MTINTWWQSATTTQAESFDKLTKIIDQVNILRKDMEVWKKNWNDNSLFINLLYNENLEKLIDTNNSTLEALQRQLKLKSKMITELRTFLDQEDAKAIKFNKRHNELVEELIKRKKKKV
jgi:hypothetical protein